MKIYSVRLRIGLIIAILSVLFILMEMESGDANLKFVGVMGVTFLFALAWAFGIFMVPDPDDTPEDVRRDHADLLAKWFTGNPFSGVGGGAGLAKLPKTGLDHRMDARRARVAAARKRAARKAAKKSEGES